MGWVDFKRVRADVDDILAMVQVGFFEEFGFFVA